MQDSYSDSDFRRTEICSDCLERDDVDLLGRVRRGREPSTADCLGCGVEQGRRKGNGRQRSNRVDLVSWWVSTQGRQS